MSVVADQADWRQFGESLRAYVARRVAAEHVEDLSADILLRLVQNQAQLLAADSPRAWMMKVASNAIADHYRRRQREAEALGVLRGEDEAVEPEFEKEDPAGDLARCLLPLIRSLDDPYAQALILTDIDGESQVAAAKQLGLSVSGMKSRVQRGREKLKDAVLRCCEVQLDNGEISEVRRRDGGSRCGSCSPP